jgi:hypothetical protein
VQRRSFGRWHWQFQRTVLRGAGVPRGVRCCYHQILTESEVGRD